MVHSLSSWLAFIITRKLSSGCSSPVAVKWYSPASPRIRKLSQLRPGSAQSSSPISVPSGLSHVMSWILVPGMNRRWKYRLRWKTMCSRRSWISRRENSRNFWFSSSMFQSIQLISLSWQ